MGCLVLLSSACFVGVVCTRPAAQPCSRASCSPSQQQHVCLALLMIPWQLEPHGTFCTRRSTGMTIRT